MELFPLNHLLILSKLMWTTINSSRHYLIFQICENSGKPNTVVCRESFLYQVLSFLRRVIVQDFLAAFVRVEYCAFAHLNFLASRARDAHGFSSIFLWTRRMVVFFSRTRRAMLGETYRYLHLHTTSENFSIATFKKIFRWKSTFRDAHVKRVTKV